MWSTDVAKDTISIFIKGHLAIAWGMKKKVIQKPCHLTR